VLPGCELYVPLDGVLTSRKELERWKEEIANLEKLSLLASTRKFANPDFASRAKPEVVEGERERPARVSPASSNG